MRINLTLAGFGGGSSGKAPVGNLMSAVTSLQKPKPTTPTPPPMAKTPAQMNAAAAGTRQGAENIRNTGGGRGMDIASTTSRALKQLTGQ